MAGGDHEKLSDLSDSDDVASDDDAADVPQHVAGAAALAPEKPYRRVAWRASRAACAVV